MGSRGQRSHRSTAPMMYCRPLFTMVPWPWYHASMVTRCHGNMVPSCHGAMVSLYHGRKLTVLAEGCLTRAVVVRMAFGRLRRPRLQELESSPACWAQGRQSGLSPGWPPTWDDDLGNGSWLGYCPLSYCKWYKGILV